jgi:myo-inositol-1(or 4)-monophosphatase
MEERGEVAGDDAQHAGSSIRSTARPTSCTASPIFAISIALERQGQIVARRGSQSGDGRAVHRRARWRRILNDRRLRVSGRTKLSDAVIATGIPHLGRGHHGNYLIELRNVMAEVSGVRRMGAAALDLAYVAAGRVDGFWEAGLSPWDIAAGMLLVREAGGFVSDMKGGQEMFEDKTIVAGNEAIHRALARTVRKPLKPAREALPPASLSVFRRGPSASGHRRPVI